MKISTGLILLLVIGMASCGPKGRYDAVDPFLKSMFNWQLGSYWVMQDSVSGNIDSFYVATNQPSTISTGDNTIERLQIHLTEVGLSNPSDKTDWYFDFAGLTTGIVTFISSVSPDTPREFPQFFKYPSGHSDIDFSSYGQTYSHVFYNSSAFFDSISSERLSLAVNESSGLIWLSAVAFPYKHTWFLLRKNIVRSS